MNVSQYNRNPFTFYTCFGQQKQIAEVDENKRTTKQKLYLCFGFLCSKKECTIFDAFASLKRNSVLLQKQDYEYFEQHMRQNQF